MKTTIPTTSLEDIDLEATIRPVTEDLDGIARRLPCRFRRDRPGNPIINRPLFRELTGRDSENYPARAGVGSGSCFWMS